MVAAFWFGGGYLAASLDAVTASEPRSKATVATSFEQWDL